jgi:hypothetical protein
MRLCVGTGFYTAAKTEFRSTFVISCVLKRLGACGLGPPQTTAAFVVRPSRLHMRALAIAPPFARLPHHYRFPRGKLIHTLLTTASLFSRPFCNPACRLFCHFSQNQGVVANYSPLIVPWFNGEPQAMRPPCGARRVRLRLRVKQ